MAKMIQQAFSQEFETKVLEIDVVAIAQRLLDLGAKKYPQVLMKRWVFDIDPLRDEWLRLRDDGRKITLTYKCKSGFGINQTEEVGVEVGDFQKTATILSKLDFKGKYYQENRRTLFRLKDIEFTIDSWPKVPPYLEVESSSERKVKKGLSLLGLENKDAGNLTVKEVYSRYGLDLHSFAELKF
jgi:adenylate cyclase class 2